MTVSEKRTIDWERIEVQYRAGLLSTREIAAQHRVSHTAINKRAKTEGWDRDLSARIRARAEAVVSKAEVSAEVSNAKLATDREVVEAAGNLVASIHLTQRSDIKRARAVGMKLLAELEAQTDELDLVEQLADAIRDDDPEKRLDALERVISLGSRTKVAKDLADTLKNLVGLEREAYGIDRIPPEPPPAPEINDDEAVRRIAFAMVRGAEIMEQRSAATTH